MPIGDPVKLAGLRGKCLCCLEDSKETAEHLVLECKTFSKERQRHIEPTIEKNKPCCKSEAKYKLLVMRTLLGGEKPASGRKTVESVVALINYLSEVVPKRASLVADLKGHML